MTWTVQIDSENILSERITITKESTLSLMCDLAQQVYWFDVNTFKILRANFSDT